MSCEYTIKVREIMCLFIDMIYWVYSNNFQKFHPTFEYEFVFDETFNLFHIFCYNLIIRIKPLA